VFPLVHTIAVDNPEHCILAGTLYGYGTNCQCSACLTPKDALGDLEGSAKYPVRTVQMFTALRAAMEDASGRKAMQLYNSHLEAEAAVNTASAGTKRRREDSGGTADVADPSAAQAKLWVNETFKSMSYRKGILPALHDFPAAGGGYAILGLSYDRLHMARLGAFKRLAILALAVYASSSNRPLKAAIELLNSRFVSRGKHDGLDRSVSVPCSAADRAHGTKGVL
jgi:hypothetical protein